MLEISNLSFGFRHRRLFQDLSLTAQGGELIHIAGPNGAGKSTFMAVVAGLLAADTGSIQYHSDDVTVPDRREYLEYLPAEANGLYLKMDATQNLLFWANLRGVPLGREAAFAALDPWNLNHPLLRDGFPVDKFSTGMKRRLALARLGLSPAPGWLLDEPVYGLDAEAMSIFRDRLAAHLARGGFALVISHDLQPLNGLITRTVNLAGRRSRES
jgi:heme exporter protein A